ncbi:MAG: hypothetical protein EPN93_07275 [Spirochaetes bacterium]|nr:MAG: hypothetical protein EPN93_07275 [Spirochaetota bacterium]
MKPEKNPGFHRYLAGLVLAACALAPSCSRSPGIDRATVPVESAYVEAREGRMAVARALGLTVSLEPVAPADFERILDYKPYTNKEHSATLRIPPLEFFQLVIQNDRGAPMLVSAVGTELSYGKETLKRIPGKDLAARFTSPAFSFLNFPAFEIPRRLASAKTGIADIDYDDDLGEIKDGNLAAGDRMLMIVAFDWIPVAHRGFRVTVRPEGDPKKSIDFDFTRFEYRTKGERFKKPEKQDKEPY